VKSTKSESTDQLRVSGHEEHGENADRPDGDRAPAAAPPRSLAFGHDSHLPERPFAGGRLAAVRRALLVSVLVVPSLGCNASLVPPSQQGAATQNCLALCRSRYSGQNYLDCADYCGR